ncbi:MAG: DUF5989 family protein [Planctomycetota bacterium]
MGEFWKFLMENKAWWITPTVVIILGLVALIWLTDGESIAPFVYNLF